MTHPTTGGGSTGPGRQVTALSTEQREGNYRRQTGTARLTPRQRRRAEHKANLAAKRAELAA